MTVILTKLLIASVFGFAFLAPFALTYLITNWLLRRKDRYPDPLSRWADDGGSVAQKPIQKLPEGK